MDHLTARLESLLRLYAAAFDQAKGDGAQLAEQFRKDLGLIVAEYGPQAVNAALDEMPYGTGRRFCFIDPMARNARDAGHKEEVDSCPWC